MLNIIKFERLAISHTIETYRWSLKLFCIAIFHDIRDLVMDYDVGGFVSAHQVKLNILKRKELTRKYNTLQTNNSADHVGAM